VLVLVLTLCALFTNSSPPPGKWNLVIEDHFNTFNSSLWTKGWSWCTKAGCSPPVKTKSGGDVCYFPDEAVYVENGNLVIQADRKSMGGWNYTSGVVNSAQYNSTQGHACHFGYYEVRLKAVLGGWEGFCSTMWFPNTVCDRSVDPENTCEIDMEIPTGKCCGLGNLPHFSTQNNGGFTEAVFTCSERGYCDEFNIYGILWESDQISFYFNGLRVGATNDKSQIPQNPGWMVLDNEIGLGGNDWNGYPSDDAPFPFKMYVDYVRMYERVPTPPPPNLIN